MIFLEFENEVMADFGFDNEKLARMVIEQVLKQEGCPFDSVSINILLTDSEGIREYNRDYRNIDKETDVLSFPNLEFEEAGKYEVSPEEEASCFDFDNGSLILGDIILCKERIESQAKEYGHSVRREMAFLIAHSMLHLSGYDHMTEDEAKDMEARQELALNSLGITRD